MRISPCASLLVVLTAASIWAAENRELHFKSPAPGMRFTAGLSIQVWADIIPRDDEHPGWPAAECQWDGDYEIAGTKLTFKTAPTSEQTVWARYIGVDYEQTVNHLGGLAAVQPDGPGYPMRTYNVGLAYGYDLLYDYAGFTPQLKREFAAILDAQCAWYEKYGYEHNLRSGMGNYYVEGWLTGAMYTAFAIARENPERAAHWKDVAHSLLLTSAKAGDEKLPGGYGPQGQYTNGNLDHILRCMCVWRDNGGEDLIANSKWIGNTIPAIIHGTKPDRVTFYDGGDWSDLPARPLFPAINSMLRYVPDQANNAFGRQLLQDARQPVPAGKVKDYKAMFEPHYYCQASGPVYMRSDWTNQAVWASLSAGEDFIDHQHRDAGHLTINRGGDYLRKDAGGYGESASQYHNVLLFDDRGAGNLSVYPPNQGVWGGSRVKIQNYYARPDMVYAQADATWAYVNNDGARNSVKSAGGHIIRQGGLFFWVGYDTGPGRWPWKINLYSSRNLADWKFENTVIRMEGQFAEMGWAGRPALLHCTATRMYIIVLEADSPRQWKRHKVGFAVCDRIDGKYELANAQYPEAERSTGDQSVYQEGDKAYLIATMDKDVGGRKYMNQSLAIFELSKDFLRVERKVFEGFDNVSGNRNVVPREHSSREASHIIKVGDVYYWFSSALVGWNSSATMYATAKDLAGPWSQLKMLRTDPPSNDSYNTQHDFVFPVVGSEASTWVYVGDRYSQWTRRGTGRNIFLPLVWENSEPALRWQKDWKIDVTSGRFSAAQQ